MEFGSLAAAAFEATTDRALALAKRLEDSAPVRFIGKVNAVADRLRVKLGVSEQLKNTLILAAVNRAGFSRLSKEMRQGMTALGRVSIAHLGLEAYGLALQLRQLQGLQEGVDGLGDRMEELLELERATGARAEKLVEFAERSAEAQERMVELLLNSRTTEAQELAEQGWENLRYGYADEAAERFRRALHFDNTLYVAHAALADLHREQHETEAAEDHYRKAVAFSEPLEPGVEGYARVQLARFLEEQDRLPEALACVDEALERRADPRWRFYRAELLARTGAHEEALEALSALIPDAPEYFAAAAGSEILTVLGDPLVELLVDLDRRAREAHVDALDALGRLIEACETLGAGAERAAAVPDPEAPARNLEAPAPDPAAHRARAAALLTEGLSVPYRTLTVEVHAAVEALRTEAEAALDTAAEHLNARLQAQVDEVEGFKPLIESKPMVQRTTRGTTWQVMGILSVLFGLFVLVTAVGILFTGGEGWIGATLVGVAVAFGALGAALLARHYARRAESRRKREAPLRAWQARQDAWEEDRAALQARATRVLEDARTRVGTALELLPPTPEVDALRERLRAIAGDRRAA